MSAILQGFRVLDLTTVLAGPFPTLMLAEYGAEVIKVESPAGDTVRDIGPFKNDRMGALYLHANRGKRSIVLDLKQSSGRAALLRIVGSCDIFVHNMRAKAIKNLGFDYASIKAIRPDIIYAGLYGFDQRGPYADKPAYDDLIQGVSGIAHLAQRAGSERPRYAPLAIADRYTGMSAFSVILGAVIHRLRTGQGQEVSVPMFETMAHLVLSDHLGAHTFGEYGEQAGYPRLLSHNRAPYQTKDGYICLMVYNDRQWRRFFEAIGDAQIIDTDPRFSNMTSRAKNIDSLYELISTILLGKTTAEWLMVLEEADIPVMRMNTLDSLEADEQLKATGLLSWTDHPTEGRIRTIGIPSVWSESQPESRTGAPTFGQHTSDILKENGFAQSEIEQMLISGAAIDAQAHLKESVS
jgi:crotonobetainyl-CoA:carnitine CoA-transferase CaiB-like acyl-CoA transferase